MSQLSAYGPVLASRRHTARLPDYAVGDAAPPRERALPSLAALAAGCYLISVPLLSSWKETTAWIPQVVGLGAGLTWLVFGLVMGKTGVAWTRPILYYMAWAAWAATGLMVTINLEYFYINYRALAKVVAITWVVSQCVRTRADLLACLLMLGLTGFMVFYTGVDEILRAAAYQGSREKVGSRVEADLLSNANSMGMFGMAVLLSCLTAFWGFRARFFKLLSVAGTPIALYMIAASGSRMTMVGVMVAGATMYWYHLRKMGGQGVDRKLAMLILGTLIAIGSIIFVAKNPFFFRLRAAFADSDAVQKQPRTLYFFRGMQATAENPVFGLGLGGFAAHGLGGRGSKGHFSHSVVTETLSCTGIPGFLLYFASQFAFYNLVRKLRKAPLPKWDMATVNMLMVVFWTFFIMNLASVPMADRLLWPLFGAFCGYLFALKKRYLDAPRPAEVLTR